MKTKLKSFKSTPGVYEVLVSYDGGNKWDHPKTGRRYVAYGYTKAGKRIKKHFKTFQEAKDFKNNISSGGGYVEDNKTPTPIVNVMKLSELFEIYQKLELIHRSVNTRDKYPCYIRYYEPIWQTPISEITVGKIDELFAWLKSDKQMETYTKRRCNFKHEFTFLKTLLNYYRETVDNNYRIPILKRHRSNLKIKEVVLKDKDLTREQADNFFNALKKNPNELFYYLANFQYFTYSRIQGAVALHFEDFDFKLRVINLNKKIVFRRGEGLLPELHQGSKAGRGKVISMSPKLEGLFYEWTKKRGISAGPLFMIDGTWPTYRSIQYANDKAFKAAGIEFSATHILRYASLSEAQECGKDLKITQKLAGHKNISTTARYAKVRDRRLCEVQNLVEQGTPPEIVRNSSHINNEKGELQ